MNKGRREGQGERANNNKEFSYVFVWCLFRSLIGPKSGQNPKKKKHPNLQPHLEKTGFLERTCLVLFSLLPLSWLLSQEVLRLRGFKLDPLLVCRGFLLLLPQSPPLRAKNGKKRSVTDQSTLLFHLLLAYSSLTFIFNLVWTIS